MAYVSRDSRVLAVSGSLGAGKSTLVDGLCRHLGWVRAPAKSPDPAYVRRIHEQPERWSFEAQLNFLVLKASSLREAALTGRNVIVDRSLYEDRDVMARSWAERFWDERSRTTYEDCATMLFAELPVADVVIYCQCSSEECERRRSARRRSYQALYDPGWVARLGELYAQWLQQFQAAPLLAIDTEVHDVRDPAVVDKVVADLQAYFAPPPLDQTVLFGLDGIPLAEPLIQAREQPPLRLLQRLNNVAPRQPVTFQARSSTLPSEALVHPAVYLAAPFTTVAVASPTTHESLLPDGGRLHGIIPDDYRSTLEAIASVVEDDGVHVILPHRDVNSWGARSLTPAQVAQSCLELVRSCDGFLGVLGESFGAHTEAGMALAQGKPCTIVAVEELGHTFLGDGMRQIPGVQNLTARTLADVPAALERAGIETLVR